MLALPNRPSPRLHRLRLRRPRGGRGAAVVGGGRSLSPGFRSAYLLMLALTAVQGAAGLLAFSAYRPRELLHVLYGLFALLFLPGVYLYAGRGPRPREAAFLAAACWIVAVAYGRGILTGGGGATPP